MIILCLGQMIKSVQTRALHSLKLELKYADVTYGFFFIRHFAIRLLPKLIFKTQAVPLRNNGLFTRKTVVM